MKNKTEFAIGEEVQMGLVTLVCVEVTDMSYRCNSCFYHKICDRADDTDFLDSFTGYCGRYSRTDKKDIIFKLKDNGKD